MTQERHCHTKWSQKEKTKYHILMNYMESIKMVPTTDEPICREAMET